jgi:hypothetical protein
MARASRKNGEKTGGGRFGPGNPGRPKGARNKTTIVIEQLLESEGEAIARKAIERALAGDSVALRLCLERISPVRRGRAITFPMPTIDSTADLAKAMGAILAGVASGTLTAEEGLTVANIVEAKRRAIETIELDDRIARLERAQAAEEDETP